jgi:hypothetical protein
MGHVRNDLNIPILFDSNQFLGLSKMVPPIIMLVNPKTERAKKINSITAPIKNNSNIFNRQPDGEVMDTPNQIHPMNMISSINDKLEGIAKGQTRLEEKVDRLEKERSAQDKVDDHTSTLLNRIDGKIELLSERLSNVMKSHDEDNATIKDHEKKINDLLKFQKDYEKKSNTIQRIMIPVITFVIISLISSVTLVIIALTSQPKVQPLYQTHSQIEIPYNHMEQPGQNPTR